MSYRLGKGDFVPQTDHLQLGSMGILGNKLPSRRFSFEEVYVLNHLEAAMLAQSKTSMEEWRPCLPMVYSMINIQHLPFHKSWSHGAPYLAR